MAQESKLERSMLDGKDREELHAIAGAIGVKGVTRLKKADLVDAILTAAGNGAASGADGAGAKTGNGDAPRRVRSRKAAPATEDDPIAALAAEEASLESSSTDADADGSNGCRRRSTDGSGGRRGCPARPSPGGGR